MELKVKRHTNTAKLPVKAHQGDLGYDIFADEDVLIPSGEHKLIPTGISVFTSSYKHGFIIKDRSSMAVKGLFSHAGVIDSGYTGKIRVLLQNVNATAVKIEKGDKIAQLVPTKVIDFEVEEVKEMFKTRRGSKGFGSTGK
jgi:dUTP pyrophosphatase